MADEPKNPQQAVDESSKKLEAVPPLMQTAPVETQPTTDLPLPETPTIPSSPPPPAEQETIVIAPKDQKQEPPPKPSKPPKKKGGKGMLIGMLLFFILTLPVAIYYGSQKYQQITEQRGRAAEGVYPFVKCCPKCSGYYANYSDTTCPGASEKACNINSTYCVRWHTITCPARVDCGSGPGNTPTPTVTHTPTTPPGATNTPTTPPGATNTPTTPPGATNTPTTPPEVPTSTPTNTPTNTPTAYYTPAPGQCDVSCESDDNCDLAYYCVVTQGIKRCRNIDCPDQSDCTCPSTSTNTPIPTRAGGTYVYNPSGQRTYVYYTPTPIRERVIAEAPVATPTNKPIPKVPVSGTIDLKAIIMTVGALLFVALGIIL